MHGRRWAPDSTSSQPYSKLDYLNPMSEAHSNNNAASVSAEIADWSRERPRQFWDPGRKLLLAIRRYQYWRHRKGFIAHYASKLLVLRHRFWSVITGADIPLNCNIGGGLLLVHPNGIVIHPAAKIGVNCLIFQQVTIGVGEDGAPQIDGHVDIGAGAKILGAVRIGAHAKIGANAVVLNDIPGGGVAIGVPATNIG
jgi:serine O-acetyltransferase